LCTNKNNRHHPKEREFILSKSKKKTRRFLRRVSKRKGIEYRDAIEHFCKKKICEIEKTLLISLNK